MSSPTERIIPANLPITTPPQDDSTSGQVQFHTSQPGGQTATTSLRMTQQVGMILGKCLLTGQLGRGASGIVYRALHQSLNIPVAVKVLRAEEKDLDLYPILKAEARLLAQLNHPNIVRILDFDESQGVPFLVMEFVEGRSLSDLIKQSGKLRLDRALNIIIQVADGLNAAWNTGIIHRDVKPGNILLDKNGNAKIADLGQAIVSCRILAGQMALSQPVGEGGGTPAYMAPEQFESPSSVDWRADVYALGATFYHALTGQMPFTGKSLEELMIRHMTHLPTPPHELDSGIPLGVSALILRMLSKKPEDRFVEHGELLQALRPLLLKFQPDRTEPIYQSPTKEPEVLRSDAMRLFREGVEAAKSGNKVRAASLLRAVTELETNHEEAWLWLASVSPTTQQVVTALENATEINPVNQETKRKLQLARLHAGYAELKVGNRNLARRHLERILSEDPRHEASLIGLSVASDSIVEAVSLLQRVLSINPENAKARLLMERYESRSAGLKSTETSLLETTFSITTHSGEYSPLNSGKVRPLVLFVDNTENLKNELLPMMSGFSRAELATDAESARRRIEARTPEMILLSITIPALEGYQISRMVKNSPGARKVPVIMLGQNNGHFDLTILNGRSDLLDRIGDRGTNGSRLTRSNSTEEVALLLKEFLDKAQGS